MLDQGYRRGVIEGGLAVQAIQHPVVLEQVERERIAQLRLAWMREHGYTGVESATSFMEGFGAGWDAACRFLVPMPALEEI